MGTYTHCGWHEPVVPGGDEVAGAEGGRARVGRGMMAGVWVAAVAVGALL